ncbi:MAG TPA: GGDEF domain-containing protein [Pyrinomonadaceae bacterium]|nr:GGDEF domain-containing protein [Pyrinomonadaceae bacterium]
MPGGYDDTDSPTQVGEVLSTQDSGTTERRPVLIALGGELLATPIPLERPEVTLGRALDAHVRLNDQKASRLHACISTEVDANSGTTIFRVKDLNSTNGTLLNGRPVTEAVLNHGDKILVGNQLFRFELLDEIDRAFQQQIHRLIGHDELTGLLSSKSFFTELNREAARAEELSHPFCVLMMDLDHFKAVNDNYGHLVGNRTLQDVGVIIKAALRSGDVAARFGGEEFAAFLLDADYLQGLVAAERVRRGVEQALFSAAPEAAHPKAERFHLTVSIGVACFPDDARDPIRLVELADSALYRAKRNGRNVTCAYRHSLALNEGPLRPRRD